MRYKTLYGIISIHWPALNYNVDDCNSKHICTSYQYNKSSCIINYTLDLFKHSGITHVMTYILSITIDVMAIFNPYQSYPAITEMEQYRTVVLTFGSIRSLYYTPSRIICPTVYEFAGVQILIGVYCPEPKWLVNVLSVLARTNSLKIDEKHNITRTMTSIWDNPRRIWYSIALLSLLRGSINVPEPTIKGKSWTFINGIQENMSVSCCHRKDIEKYRLVNLETTL